MSLDAQKDAAAERAVALVKDGMRVGLGTGSTAAFAVRRLGARVRAGLSIRGVPTSESTHALAQAEGIPIASLDDVDALDIAIDGTDEADAGLDLIKGGGGALLREKIVARLSKRFIVIADATKLVPALGAFPLPVEITPFAKSVVARALATLGCTPKLRMTRDGKTFVTDNGNQILDCHFGRIDDPLRVAAFLDALPGVVEHGLFLGMTELLLLGQPDGSVREMRRR